MGFIFNTKVAKSAKGRGYKNEEQAIEPIAEIAADAMVQVQLAMRGLVSSSRSSRPLR